MPSRRPLSHFPLFTAPVLRLLLTALSWAPTAILAAFALAPFLATTTLASTVLTTLRHVPPSPPFSTLATTFSRLPSCSSHPPAFSQRPLLAATVLAVATLVIAILVTRILAAPAVVSTPTVSFCSLCLPL
ncbi:hypothetical protein BOTBODRAFT_182312 [Botryobasidium botryosum FD-172 SS1]|uniref:Uncharacterized protein n=1 Tax=Botryobasidium botryosum (strain FD-172 SS1) TaxID=930990 RepID=A0A067LRR2_BOTB1|nr:hypothetical protein BOTBODRAFT_182312 [Botryobasidium botryosum FD-172 SS1]